MKTIKKLIPAILLVLVFVLSSCNDVYVNTNDDNKEVKETTTVPPTTEAITPTTEAPTNSVSASYNVGDIVYFGSYEQDNNFANGAEPIEWIVLDATDTNYLLLSKYALDCKQYNITDTSTTWDACSLHSWLNGQFLNSAFTDSEKAKLSNYSAYTSSDAVFCLSGFEADKYLPSANDKITSATPYAQANGSYQEKGVCGWWLRGRGERYDLAARVNIKGEILTCDSSEGGVARIDYSVRPAIWMSK